MEDRRFLVPMLVSLVALIVALAAMGVTDADWLAWVAVGAFAAFVTSWFLVRFGMLWTMLLGFVVLLAFLTRMVTT